jgi:hypothetical protein
VNLARGCVPNSQAEAKHHIAGSVRDPAALDVDEVSKEKGRIGLAGFSKIFRGIPLLR